MIRETFEISDEASDPIQLGYYYDQSDSFLEEIISMLDHVNPLFKYDNVSVYSMAEEAARGNVYAPTIKTYARKKDGRAAWKSIFSSNDSRDKWEQLQKENLNFLIQTKWNGRVYSLEKFVGLHQNFFVQLQEASDHVNFQLPTNHSKLGFLIDNMSNIDPDLLAAITSVHNNTKNMHDDFEGDAGFFSPSVPICKASK